jgi:hypothetical protein
LGIFAVDMNIYNLSINHKEQIVEAIGGTSFSVTNNPSLKASLYTDFLQVNNSFDVPPIASTICSLWLIERL